MAAAAPVVPPPTRQLRVLHALLQEIAERSPEDLKALTIMARLVLTRLKKDDPPGS